MSKFLTIEKLNAAEDAHHRHWPQSRFRRRFREPHPEERAFTSSRMAVACLTHLTRHVADLSKRDAAGGWVHIHRTHTAWCGTTMSSPVLVDVEGEMFACHKCIEVAERYDASTFSLIPNTGCEVSEGKRWLPRRLRDRYPTGTESLIELPERWGATSDEAR